MMNERRNLGWQKGVRTGGFWVMLSAFQARQLTTDDVAHICRAERLNIMEAAKLNSPWPLHYKSPKLCK